MKEKGVWRHDDGTPCGTYPDSMDWTYVPPGLNPEWRCGFHDKRMVSRRRPRTATEQDVFERERIARVKGKNIRLTRLDDEGKPTGETFDVKGTMSGHFEPAFPETEVSYFGGYNMGAPLQRLSMDITLKEVNPELIALLIGYTFKPRPWWWKFLPRAIQRKIKRRELRRGYGG